MYQAYITKLKDLRPHPNADRLQLAECFGNTVCVSLDYTPNQLGVYFPCDGQLDLQFCQENNLIRIKSEDGTNTGGYLDPDKRNIKAIRLRGEKSDGLFLPLTCLDYTGVSPEILVEGFCFSEINGFLICQKYIPRGRGGQGSDKAGNRTRKKKVNIAPLFMEHADTEQLAYNLSVFKPNDLIEITLKMHGTSQRTGYLPVLKGYNDSLMCEIGNALKFIYLRFAGRTEEFEPKHDGEPIYEYGYVTGTRRVVLDKERDGWYGSNEFRKQHAQKFEGKLWKGETVYYEVVGFTDTGAPIMGNGNNKKVNDKEFVKQYGEETVFSYGCEPFPDVFETIEEHNEPQSDIYVYRMTMTNEDGNIVEYTPDFMRYRCEQMGIKCVPVFWKGFIPQNPGSKDDPTIEAGEWIQNKAELYYDGPDPIGKTHIREGVVVRILNKPKFCAYKHKNYNFKVLEGIIKESATAPDMEEAQDIVESEEI